MKNPAPPSEAAAMRVTPKREVGADPPELRLHAIFAAGHDEPLSSCCPAARKNVVDAWQTSPPRPKRGPAHRLHADRRLATCRPRCHRSRDRALKSSAGTGHLLPPKEKIGFDGGARIFKRRRLPRKSPAPRARHTINRAAAMRRTRVICRQMSRPLIWPARKFSASSAGPKAAPPRRAHAPR